MTDARTKNQINKLKTNLTKHNKTRIKLKFSLTWAFKKSNKFSTLWHSEEIRIRWSIWKIQLHQPARKLKKRNCQLKRICFDLRHFTDFSIYHFLHCRNSARKKNKNNRGKGSRYCAIVFNDIKKPWIYVECIKPPGNPRFFQWLQPHTREIFHWYSQLLMDFFCFY